MHETREDLEALQQLLDDSYERAGRHLRSIQRSEHRLVAAQLCARLQRVCVVDLATVTRAGEPRVAPIDALFFRARFCIGARADSQRARQLGHNPAVSAAYTRRALTVLVHGTAREIDCADPGESGLRDCFRESYGLGYDAFGSWGKEPFWRLEPRLMFAAVLSE